MAAGCCRERISATPVPRQRCWARVLTCGAAVRCLSTVADTNGRHHRTQRTASNPDSLTTLNALQCRWPYSKTYYLKDSLRS